MQESFFETFRWVNFMGMKPFIKYKRRIFPKTNISYLLDTDTHMYVSGGEKTLVFQNIFRTCEMKDTKRNDFYQVSTFLTFPGQ